MKKTTAIELMEARCRERVNFRTRRTYVARVKKFVEWKDRHRAGSVSDYLSEIAPHVAKATQKQTLNAIAFFYKHVVGKPMGKLTFRYSEAPPRAPVCLSLEECHQLFGQMRGLPQFQAQLMFGTGLRISEMLALRIKDVDFANGSIVVRGGKGDKDRSVPMPHTLRDQLAEQIEKAEFWWKVDRDAKNPPPYLPTSLAGKLGEQVAELPWFWLFPATNLSRDPDSGIVRRHHVTAQGVAKAIKIAARRAGIRKRVTPHTLRHSFATSLLVHGADIKTVSVLLGHATTKTTERYLHAVPSLQHKAVSPLDLTPGNVVPVAFGEVPSKNTPRNSRRRAHGQ